MSKKYTLAINRNQFEAIYESVCHMNRSIELGEWGWDYSNGQIKDLKDVEGYLWTML